MSSDTSVHDVQRHDIQAAPTLPISMGPQTLSRKLLGVVFLRKVKTASGAPAVQIARRVDRCAVIVEPLSSAHTKQNWHRFSLKRRQRIELLWAHPTPQRRFGNSIYDEGFGCGTVSGDIWHIWKARWIRSKSAYEFDSIA